MGMSWTDANPKEASLCFVLLAAFCEGQKRGLWCGLTLNDVGDGDS